MCAEKVYYVFFWVCLDTFPTFSRWLLSHVGRSAAVCLFSAHFKGDYHGQREWELKNIHSIRCTVDFFFVFLNENSLFSHLFSVSFKTGEIVIHHAFWSGTLWTCPVCTTTLSINARIKVLAFVIMRSILSISHCRSLRTFNHILIERSRAHSLCCFGAEWSSLRELLGEMAAKHNHTEHLKHTNYIQNQCNESCCTVFHSNVAAELEKESEMERESTEGNS